MIELQDAEKAVERLQRVYCDFGQLSKTRREELILIFDKIIKDKETGCESNPNYKVAKSQGNP